MSEEMNLGEFQFPTFVLNDVLGKILVVGDLHLYNKELSSTKGMVENNMIMLENIYSFLEENEDIKLLIFLGDIQHITPSGKNTLKEVTKWKKAFKKIGELMKPRFERDLVKVIFNTRADEHPFEDFYSALDDGDAYPVFTLKGNHDIDTERMLFSKSTEEAEEEPYTFFDICIDEGLLVNPNQIILDGKVLLNFYNYAEYSIPYPSYKGVEYTIALMHETILTVDSPNWVVETKAGLDPKEFIFADLVIDGHIHENYPPRLVENAKGTTSVVWIIGSMGRTQISGDANNIMKGQVRDVGYSCLIDTQDFSALPLVEIDVMPHDKYFNMRTRTNVLAEREEVRNFNFNLKKSNSDTNFIITHDKTPIEVIQEVEDVEQNVKDICISILTSIENKQVKE